MKCKKCGSTENVNFEGMCKKCYDESVVIKEKTEDEEKKKVKKDEIGIYDKAKLFLSKNMKEKYLQIEICLTITLIISIILGIRINTITSSSKDQTKKDYDLINSKYSQSQKDLENQKKKTEEANKKIEELSQEDKKKELEKSISSLESKISELTKNKEDLDTQISQLNGEVVKLKGQPKSYPAGQLTAGTDIPTGKYKIYGGSSNFVVYSSSGSLQVNIILGTGSYNVSEYIYTFKTGDKIEANSSFKLVEVE